MMDVRGKKALVVGLGASGSAAAELLARRGAAVSITESSADGPVRERLSALRHYGVRHELGGHTEDFCADADLVVASPGIDPAAMPLSLASERGVPVIGELELGYAFCAAPIIAITGTNGKSTVTELTGHLLSRAGRHAVVCGNIGNPLSGEVDRLASDSVAVVEVSSFQLETIREFRPRVAALLNVAEDHYDRHGTFEEYKAGKFRIFENQSGTDCAVLHSGFSGDPLTTDVKGRLFFYGDREASAFVDDGGAIILRLGGREEKIMRADEVPLAGAHNLENAACCALIAGLMGTGAAEIRDGIKTFSALSHRFESMGDFGGVEYIDDSKATNIDATRRALESVGRRVVLIAGGIDKGGDYVSIRHLVRDRVKAMVLIGEAREKIKALFSEEVPVFTEDNMAGAVEKASSLAEEGDTVMLSPMCSSFDMFSGYKERGEVFQKEVKRLKGEKVKR